MEICRSIYDNGTNDLMAFYAENKNFFLLKSQHVQNLFPTDLCLVEPSSEHIRILPSSLASFTQLSHNEFKYFLSCSQFNS